LTGEPYFCRQLTGRPDTCNKKQAAQYSTVEKFGGHHWYNADITKIIFYLTVLADSGCPDRLQ
jgi:hypothetical protein